MRKGTFIIATLVILAASGLSVASPALAQSEDKASNDWQFRIIPDFWLVGVSGDIRAGNLIDTTIDASFSDILKSLDFGLMGAFQVRKGRVAFIFDGMYAKLSKDGLASGGLGESVRAGIKVRLYSFAVSYRILKGWAPLSIVGGIRVMPIQADLEVTSGIAEGTQTSGSNTSLDGFVGASLAFPLMSRWTLEGYADIGTGDSKLTWQTLAGLSYKLSRTMSAKFGFRYLSIENEKPDFRTKIGIGGFYAGVGILL